MVLKDIIKAARFHITESRGIKFELRQGVIKTFRYEPIPRRARLHSQESQSKLLVRFKATLYKAYHSIHSLYLNRETFC